MYGGRRNVSGSDYLSEATTRELVHGFYQTLTGKNLDKLISLLSDEASLSWGPYDFKGKESILTWAGELFELFPFMTFKEKSLEVQGSLVKHEFLIAFMTSQGQKGWLPCEGTYEFDGDKFSRVKVNLLHGFLAVNRDDVERVKPHATG
jgi:hypothetical protein